jgi:hypothetical protein
MGMPKQPVVDRHGPGLIDLMARSAVISQLPAGDPPAPAVGRVERREAPGNRATDRYLQLYELMEAGVLTRTEFKVAVGRLTRMLSRRPSRRRSAVREPEPVLKEEHHGTRTN